MSIRMLHNLLAVKRDDDINESIGKIILTESEKSCTGTVVSVGPGVYSPDGSFMQTTVKIGDVVTFHKDVGDDMKIEDEILLIVPESNIIGVLQL